MNNIPTICQLSSGGFQGTYFEYLYSAGKKAGVRQLFISSGFQNKPSWFVEDEESKYLSLNCKNRFNYFTAIWRIVSILRKERVHILQTHMFDGAILGTILNKFLRRSKLIVTRHHLDEPHLLGNRVHVFLDRYTNLKAHAVVVPSNATKKFMIDVEKQSGRNVHVIPYGFDFEEIVAAKEHGEGIRKEFDLGDSFVIGCVGRIFPNKGHRFLFRAVAQIIPSVPNLKILLLGDGNRTDIEEELNRLGLREKVIFAGYRKDVSACMRAMDVFVHPSLSESFGQVIVEAMASGCPVLVTSVGGVPELVGHEHTGLVVDPGNVAAIRENLKRLINNPKERESFALRGRASVLDRFSSERMMTRYLELYDELGELE